MNKQQGFTLIELMIVVAIIGILAAIAIPAYQDYIVRSKVTELVTAADACKVSVAEYHMSQNAWPADASTAGCNETAIGNVTGLSVASANGAITVTGGTDVKSVDIVLTPTATSGGISWVCTTTSTQKKYVPANCRG